MCGVLFYAGDELLPMNHLALDSIKHRGPDAAGVKHFSAPSMQITLGHRRLAVIDLSNNSDQPLTHPKIKKWISLNGEIYNYLELKVLLQKKGYDFHSQSDTEVLLIAFQEWGPKCLDMLNGMFAFIIWDDVNKKLFFARDRFGIKPLYYWLSKHGISFVSEIKQLTYLPGFKPRINIMQSLQFIITGDYGHAQDNIWENVVQVEPGECGTIDFNHHKPQLRIQKKQWYSINNVADKPLICIPEDRVKLVDLFKERLTDAVKLQLRSDVPVGLMLSGGIDSSCLATLLTKKLEKQIQSFSICYKEGSEDESSGIRNLCEYLKIEPCLNFIEASQIENSLDEMVYYHDYPLPGRSSLVQFLLYDVVKNHNIKVCLEGHGADEFLGGYTSFFRAYCCELIKKLKIYSAFHEIKSFKLLNQTSWVATLNPLLPHFFSSRLSRLVSYNLQYFHEGHEVIKQYAPDIQRETNSYNKTQDSRSKILRSILHTVDRASMSRSIEARVPYLDHELVEFNLALPTNMKIHHGIRKYILRQAMMSDLPHTINHNHIKRSFSSPESSWARNTLNKIFSKNMAELSDIPFIRHQYLIEDFKLYCEGKKPYNPIYWRFASFNLWRKKFDAVTDFK